jgi:hypothetical protein
VADYWAKIYIEIIDDPKMATMPDRLWRRTIEIFLLAKKFNKAGRLPDTKQLAWMLRMTTDDLDMDLKQIALTGIIQAEPIGWFVVHFEKRQAAATVAERKQQQRARDHREQYYGNEDVTGQSPIVTQRTEDRGQRTETEAAADPYNIIQSAIFSRGIIPNPNDVNYINDLVKAGVTPEDVLAGIDWKASNNGGRAVVYVSSVVGPAKTAMAKRLQKDHPGSPRTALDVNGKEVQI